MVWAMAEQRSIEGFISAVSVTNLYYIVRKERSRREALRMLKSLSGCVGFAPCDASVLNQAIDSGFSDFEDAVQYFSALAAGAEVLVTRNESHFAGAEISVMTPAAFLARHGEQ